LICSRSITFRPRIHFRKFPPAVHLHLLDGVKAVYDTGKRLIAWLPDLFKPVDKSPHHEFVLSDVSIRSLLGGMAHHQLKAHFACFSISLSYQNPVAEKKER